MADTTNRGAKSWFGLGIVAGIIFAVVFVIAAVLMGNPAITPFRLFASIILGSNALDVAAAGTVIVVGTLVHLVLSGVFGIIYGAINRRLDRQTQTDTARQAGIGLLFGVALWLVNFQIIARLLYPWFLDTPQFAAMLLHAVFYGLPLGVMYARATQAEARPRDIQRRPPTRRPPSSRRPTDVGGPRDTGERHPPGP